MAIYKCSVCGYILDEEKEGKLLSELDCCPVCKQPIDKLVLVEESEDADKAAKQAKIGKESDLEEEQKPEEKPMDLQYDSTYVRHDTSCRDMEEIHRLFFWLLLFLQIRCLA